MTLSTEREDPDRGAATEPRPWEELLKSWERRRRGSSGGRAECSGNAVKDMFVWRNEEPAPTKGKSSTPYAGKNPVAVWKLGEKSIRGIEVAPDGQSLAVVSEDGSLKIVDTASARYVRPSFNENHAHSLVLRLLDSYASYFGALTCLAWSPDGKYLIVCPSCLFLTLALIRSTSQTGGEDDLLTIISFHERRIVARCQGHTNYVTSVAFDDRRKSSARCYRFGSVGEDGRILFVSYAYPHDHWWKELMHHARGSGILIRPKR